MDITNQEFEGIEVRVLAVPLVNVWLLDDAHKLATRMANDTVNLLSTRGYDVKSVQPPYMNGLGAGGGDLLLIVRILFSIFNFLLRVCKNVAEWRYRNICKKPVMSLDLKVPLSQDNLYAKDEIAQNLIAAATLASRFLKLKYPNVNTRQVVTLSISRCDSEQEYSLEGYQCTQRNQRRVESMARKLPMLKSVRQCITINSLGLIKRVDHNTSGNRSKKTFYYVTSVAPKILIRDWRFYVSSAVTNTGDS